MRQRLVIIATIAVVIGILVLLNGLGYAESTEQSESEMYPNRSTYNAGATGTKALYDLLTESGYKVTRWRESPSALFSEARQEVSTFVVVGRTILPFEEEEAKNILLWVKKGGCLVLIDRKPDIKLLPQTGDWRVSDDLIQYPGDVDPGNQTDMTQGVPSVHPVQPTLLTAAVESVKPSRFASVIRYSYSPSSDDAKKMKVLLSKDSTEEEPEGSDDALNKKAAKDASPPAPVTHLQDSRGALLIDYPHGAGRIIVLSDPFIIANGGIQLEDNVQLALNTIGGRSGLIAFDEFHQGRAIARNAFAAYFSGTPILAMAGQLVLVILVILWTQGRRFGRPLPLPNVDRRSSLEFVASMAELQQRARALDLALENIYSRTRRVLTRYAGVDYHSSRMQIAERVAARSVLNESQLEAVMRDCENTINGAPISERQTIALAKKLRDIEAALGLRMRSRDVKQAADSRN
ncbi:MAG TPA: DUF4350 domain-containing protein [Pyrinomonadaceae bacterium]|jgi:hypothetical protein|nr:DUF4350 domain-containing protein [Pyrinomonadaceae bacterium]